MSIRLSTEADVMSTAETKTPTCSNESVNILQCSETVERVYRSRITSKPVIKTSESTSMNKASIEEIQGRPSFRSVNKRDSLVAATMCSTETKQKMITGSVNKPDASETDTLSRVSPTVETSCSSMCDPSNIKLLSSKCSISSPNLAKCQKCSTHECKNVEQKYKGIRTGQKRVSVPTLRVQKVQRTLKQRLQDYGEKHRRRSNKVNRKSRLENVNHTEEMIKLKLFSLAVDSICKCKGVVDSIAKERSGVSVEYLHRFKYILFDKAIEFVEEFNALMRILVKNELKVDVSSVLPGAYQFALTI